jgi:methylmalonyl-CoA mutase N-terminal domain/subunit
MGGMLKAIENRYPQQEIEASAYAAQTRIESGEQTIVGVNRFRSGDAAAPVFRLDPASEKAQVDRLSALRARRDAAAVASRLRELQASAAGDANLMPHILAAAEAHATVGEISDALRSVFGEYSEAV